MKTGNSLVQRITYLQKYNDLPAKASWRTHLYKHDIVSLLKDIH